MVKDLVICDSQLIKLLEKVMNLAPLVSMYLFHLKLIIILI